MEKLKVLLVDDEIEAMEYLRELINWEAKGFEIIGEATDGYKALEYFKSLNPHLVIADISMPGMNGLELCEAISGFGTSCKIILLTAYSEFEYAKKAIQLGVSNYLLKHTIDEQTLVKELEKMKEEIERDLNVKEIVNKHTILNYIEGEEHSLGIKRDWDFTKEHKDTLVMLVIKLDRPYKIFSSENEEQLPNLNVEHQIKKVIMDFTQEIDFIDIIKYKMQQHILFFKLKEQWSSRIVFIRFHVLAERIHEMLTEETGFTFSTAIVNSHFSDVKIADMYNKCKRAFEFLPVRGRVQILKADDYISQTTSAKREQQASQLIRHVIEALETAREEAVDKSVENLFYQLVHPFFDPDLLKVYCMGLEREITWWRNERHLPEIKTSNEATHHRLFSCYTVEEIKEAVKAICRLCLQQVMDKDINSYTKKIQKAIKYLNENYAKDLAVMDIADFLEISESSLTKSFKQETGYSVLEYLKMIRIYQAKHLLRNTNLKIYEISEQVGYKTSQYFSQVFIKSVGVNPLDYREGKNEPF